MNTRMKALRNISFLKEEMLEGISVGVRIHPKAALYTICTVLITVVLIIFLLNTGKTVNAAPEHELHKYYTSIEIQPGDTLWEIADIYKTEGYSNRKAFIKEIQGLNHIDENQITSGCYLLIPYYAEKPR